MLTVIEQYGKDKWKNVLWKCKCDCSKITIVIAAHLKNNNTKSCGCINGKKILNLSVGLSFGRLTILELAIKSKHKCKCDCGNITFVLATHLKNGITRSCGCLHRRQLSKRSRKDKGKSGFNTVLRTYIDSAKKRSLEFNLTKEQFSGLTKQNCYYCGIGPSQIVTPNDKTEIGKEWCKYIYNGIDRVDNNMGYLINNCVPCCIICNKMKQGLRYDEFYKHIYKILNNFIL